MIKKIQEVIQQYKEEQENIDPPSMPVESPEISESHREQTERKLYSFLDDYTHEQPWLTEEMVWDEEEDEWRPTGRIIEMKWRMTGRTKGFFPKHMEDLVKGRKEPTDEG